MKIEMDVLGTPEGLMNACQKIMAGPGTNSLLILSCDANGFSKENLDPVLTDISLPLFGGIFPEIIHGKQKLERGTIVVGLPVPSKITIIEGLSDDGIDYESTLEEMAPVPIHTRTMFVFVDGFSKRINALIESLFNFYGLEFNYLGGGAGSLSMIQQPCLFTNQGLRQDIALLAPLPIASGVGVSHGWEDVSGPYKVTASDRNVIRSLEGRPAFDLYREVVKDQTGQTISARNFFDLAKNFPFGISKLGAEKVVRDPVKVEPDGSIVCVGEIPNDSYIHILTGHVDSLISAAGKAAAMGRDSFPGAARAPMTIFFDCISRVLFLGERFGEEIESAHASGSPLVGALTIGEIANSGKDYLEFYNKTSVVGVLDC